MSTIITNNGNILSAGALNFAVSQSNSLKVDGNTLLYLTNSKVGVLNVSPAYELDTTGDDNVSGNYRVGGVIVVDSYRNITGSNISASGNVIATSFTGSFSGSIGNAITASYALTSSWANNLTGGVVIATTISSSGDVYWGGNEFVSGNLSVVGNLTVLGSSSIVNITSSQVNVGTGKITVNAYSPFVRYAGLSAQDSGSATGTTSSLFWDSLNNYWLFQGETAGGGYQEASSSVMIGGPIGSLGNEGLLTTNTIPKAVGQANIGDSLLTDNGTLLSYGGSQFSVPSSNFYVNASSVTASNLLVNNNITLTGGTISGSSNIITTAITGALSGTASWGVNATNASTASYLVPTNNYQVNSLTASSVNLSQITGSVYGTASWAYNAQTASYVTASNITGTVSSASYSINSSTASYLVPTNNYQVNVLTASAISTTQITSSLYGTASWAYNAQTASYILASNISGSVTSASYALNSSTASYLITTNNYQVNILTASAISATQITGALYGTASWAYNAQTASYITASNINGVISSASFATNALTASYITASNISGVVSSASFAINALTASYLVPTNNYQVNNLTASNITATQISASQFTGSLTGTATSASYALTASYSVASANAYIQGGNSFGATGTLGLKDTYNLNIITNNITRLAIDTNSGITASAVIVPSIDATYQLGSSTLRFKDFFSQQSTIGALFETGLFTKGISKFKTGTVLSWENGQLIPCYEEFDQMVMGVAQEGKDEPIVFGAEPILVTGIINEGDYIVTSNKTGHGMGVPYNSMSPLELYSKVIAQSLESGDGESYTLKAMIRKL